MIAVPVGRRLDILMAAPGLVWVGLFLIVPMIIVSVMSFYTYSGGRYIAEFTTENYAKILMDPVNAGIFLFTLRLSLTITVMTLVLGYPVAYFLAMKVKNESNKMVLLLLFIVPFWIEWTTRTIAWLPLLGRYGVLNTSLMGGGIISEPSTLLLFSEFSATLVMIQNYVLFMIAPIFLSMLKMDPTLLQAAETLGADRLRAFYNVTFKMSLPGVVVGCIFVFVISTGDFATPRVLGGVIFSIGQVILSQTLTAVNWPLASAYSTILIAITLGVIYLLLRIVDIRRVLF